MDGKVAQNALAEKWYSSYFEEYQIDGFLTQEAFAWALEYIHDAIGLSWPRIASLRPFSEIPMSTLNGIMLKRKVPKKHWPILRVKPHYHPRIAISKIDVDRAMRTLTRPGSGPSLEFLEDLACRLQGWVDLEKLKAE